MLVAATGLATAAPIDINSASAADFAKAIKGVGDAKAAAIVEYRSKNGPFKSVDDLAKVPGIGPKTIETNRENLRIGGESSAAPAAAPATNKAN
ncbi:competence protein ComEA [Plasticicumulans lactativorans]|uniref:Competence protein ComEA n=1 Tax=Plasticicumulans lactativorans TaxID=1133106 RepID=A0A4R2L2A8_9GAMM|nr:helix-hairpin-helix domain-containing protein [Plasticicumulans lactativorans]TCO80463.1 competence protein ComEA [Plasticicumulans lactativorans]